MQAYRGLVQESSVSDAGDEGDRVSVPCGVQVLMSHAGGASLWQCLLPALSLSQIGMSCLGLVGA